MAYICDRPGFSVRVEGEFAGDDLWLIRGHLTSRPAPQDVDPQLFEAEARLELTMGIVREALRGRDLGARHLHVALDGDHRIEGFLLGLESTRASGHAA